MWWLYSLLLFISLLVPLLLSFEKKLQFYRSWKYLLPAIFIIALFYIAFDIFFTEKGIWGFNARYHSGFTFSGLPLEELLFFIIIPYASIFLHQALIFHFPGLKTGRIFSYILSAALIFCGILLILVYPDRTYTVYTFCLLILSLIAGLSGQSGILRSYFLTFLVILVPFLVVNGILTGSLIDEEVVWYNAEEIMGIRVFTIPVEDFSYGFSLILFSLILSGKLKRVFDNAVSPSR